ncbi:MAG: error-prone DNA polymerase [Terriglobales bacterium]
MQYIELHSRSAFSFLEGASHPEALAAACAQLGMPAMALLDRDGVYGAARFHLAAKKFGIKAHIGAEVAIGKVRYPLLTASRTGYQNLCRLITCYKLRAGEKTDVSHATEDDLREFSDGLICLTGDERGPLATALEHGGTDAASQSIARLTSIFGRENIYVELQRHFQRRQEFRNQAAVSLARKFNLPLLATNGVAYASPAERELLDAFTCIRNHCQLVDAGRLLTANSERHLRTPPEMAALFADLPEAIAHTAELSARLDFTLADLGYQFPRYPVPEGETMASFLRARTLEGARTRYHPLSDRARRQLERELALIEKLGLAGYFLIVWDLIRFCGNAGILVQGRGSAANSAVCYSLGITAVDPVGMGLLFERFLSEERGEWPDIDLDLPSGDDRERVIQYVYQRYGKLGAAMTANVITYRGRSAAREMGKVLGFDVETLNRLSSLVGGWEWQDPNETIERQFREAGFDLRHPRIGRFMDLCLRVRDLPRHLGQHSGGMVICQGQLDSVVPLEPASMPGRVVVQWDKDDCADLGIVKVDLLGLGMMAVLKDSLTLIRDHYRETVDLAHLPADDPAVYDTIRRADTIGMFQIESRAQMASLPRNGPERFYDLVVQVALIRPGPIVGQMVNPYMKRRQGREPVKYPHPSLEPVLERTLGVPLFQEQLLRMAMICANFTGGEAEELHRALGSRRSQQRMREIEAKLRAGMTANGIATATQDEIVQFISSFALYGFPESHAASFALIAYASAYLKQHYLGAFTAALLNNQPMGFYHPATLVKDAQHHGLRVKPIDVTCSDWNCTIEDDGGANKAREAIAMRMGLRYVRGMREASARALLAQRALRPFASIDDLALRVPALSKNDLVMLAQVGALNGICKPAATNISQPLRPAQPHRRDALWQVDRVAQPAGTLLESLPEADLTSPLAQMTTEERLVADFHGTGLTVGPHPMAYRRAQMDAMRVLRASDLTKVPDGRRVRVAGAIIARQRPGTAHGFIFLSLEDETGISNIIVRPDIYDRDRMILLRERFLLVEGIMQNQEKVLSIKAERLERLHVSAAQMQSHDFH